MAGRKTTPRVTLPKAKNLEEALKLVPQWKSAVVVPEQCVQVFDANPGLIGGLTPELMKQFNNQTEAKLAQVIEGISHLDLCEFSLSLIIKLLH